MSPGMKSRRILQVALVLSVSIVSACSSSVRVKTRSGYSLKGQVVRAGADLVVLEQSDPVVPTKRQRVTLRRSDIVDVSHPGEALETVGPIVAGAGAALVVGGLLVYAAGHQDDCAGRTSSGAWLEDVCIDMDFTPIIEGVMIGTGAGLAITGAVLGLVGASRAEDSKHELEWEPSELPLSVEPLVGLSPDGGSIGITGTF